MPLKRFWLFNRSIDRLKAEADLRTARVAVSVGSGEAVQDLFRDLRAEMGTIVVIDHGKAAHFEELDKEGLDSIRGMGKVR